MTTLPPEPPRPLSIVVGVTGGIAAYKAVGVIRALVLSGHSVQVIATEAAFRFVGRATLEAISRKPVYSELYEGVDEVRHVALGQAADLIIIAPATANTLAKLAAGLADDLLGNTVLASLAPIVVAPAMHTEMWQNPATTANIQTLRDRGITIVGPGNGQLTGADSGPGRMVEPDDIVAAALAVLTPQNLFGVTMLVTAGGTREPLDPVRYLGNRSSGRQGVAIAAAAAARGATVTLIAANLDVVVPRGIHSVQVSTTLELSAAVFEHAPASQVVIMAAAVADYRPERVVDHKIKKEQQGERLTLELVKNPDILAGLAARRQAAGTMAAGTTAANQLIIGFAAETENDDEALLELGRAKIARKGCDYLVVNRVGWNEGFGTADNTIAMLASPADSTSPAAVVSTATGSKALVADAVLDVVASCLANRLAGQHAPHTFTHSSSN